MVSFESDYIAGAHPEIIKKLGETNFECLSGYGTDKYCNSARDKIRKACGLEEAEVEFLVGHRPMQLLFLRCLRTMRA